MPVDPYDPWKEPGERVPGLSPALLGVLDRLFPSRCPSLDWPDRRVWFEAGARSVIEFLQNEYENEKGTTDVH